VKLLRRIGIAIAGGSVLAVGIAMLVLPGPAILVIPAGLAILALEFAWAKHCLRQMRQFIAQRKDKLPDGGATSATPGSTSKGEGEPQVPDSAPHTTKSQP
jgi:hypothetical protein